LTSVTVFVWFAFDISMVNVYYSSAPT